MDLSYRLAYVGADRGLYVRSNREGKTDWLVATDVERVDYSADGSVLAYSDGTGMIHRVDLRAGDEQTAVGPEYAFAISPDGSKVAFVSGGRLRLWDGGGQPVIVDGPAHCTTPGWSADSEQVAVGAMGGNGHEDEDGGVWVWDGEGPAEQVVPAATGENAWGSSQDIMCSPDGRWLAWARGAGDGWAGDLARVDGSEVQRDVLGAGPIQWRPDSLGLLVRVPIEAGADRVGYYDLTEGQLTPFGPEYHIAVGCLSPDGKDALICFRGTGKRGLLAHLDEGTTEEFAPDLAAEAVSWCPDGRIAVAARDAPDDPNFYAWVIPADRRDVFRGELPLVPAPWAVHWVNLPDPRP